MLANRRNGFPIFDRLDSLYNILELGKTSRLQFAVDQITVQTDLEAAEPTNVPRALYLGESSGDGVR